MIMDAEDVQSDLHSLKRLYGLLIKDGGEASKTDSDLLDAPARLLLKNLLDTATKRVLKSYSEVVTGQAEASGAWAHSPARPQQPDEAASVEVYQSCEEIDFDDRLNPGWSQADEVSVPAIGQRRCSICRRNSVKPVSTDDVDRNSNLSDQHLWNRVKEIRWLSSNKSDDSKRERQRQRQRQRQRLSDLSISPERTSKPGESNCLSQEASRAMQQIEGCMSALHRGQEKKPAVQTDHGEVSVVGTSFGENFLIGNNPLFEISEESNQPYLALSQSYNPVPPTKAISKQSTTYDIILEEDKCRFPTREVNKIYVQNVNAIMENIESGNWIISANRYVPSSVELVPSNTSFITPRRPTTSSSNMEDEHSKPPPLSFMNLENHPTNIMREKLVNNQSDARHKVVSQKSRHYRTAVRTLKDQESDSAAFDSYHSPNVKQEKLVKNQSDARHKVVSQKSGHYRTAVGTSLKDQESDSAATDSYHPPNVKQEKLVKNQTDARHKVVYQKRLYRTAVRSSLQDQESDNASTDSRSNVSRSQTNSRDSSSEDSSFVDQPRGLHYVASSKSSGSWELSLSHGSGSQYSGYGSNSEEEDYSSSSEDVANEVTTSVSSEEKGYSSHEQQPHATKYTKQSKSRKSGPSRKDKTYGTSHKKQSGILKRMKDGLAVIFHHHHHHHHHHHNRGDRTKNEENMSHNSSSNKHKEKVASPKRQDNTHKEKAVEKIQKSQIHESRGQHSHFHGLMGGFLQHVRHSKQSKKGKGSSDQLAHERGTKRALKKNWWQLLQHHGQSKLHEKTHTKLGIGKKKTRLKALPKIK